MLLVKIMLVASPVLLIVASFIPKLIIQRIDRSKTARAIEEFHDLHAGPAHEPTFEERWDAADDEFMRRWSSFCSRDLMAECAREVEDDLRAVDVVLRWFIKNACWTYDHMACYFIRVNDTIELNTAYLMMKADDDGFDALKDRVDPLNDTMIWTPQMENELTQLLTEGAREEVKTP